jgi:phosphoglycerate kinase
LVKIYQKGNCSEKNVRKNMTSSEFNLPVLQDADLKGKIVLIRVDHNVVKKGVIHDPYRIDSTLGTLFHIYARGGKAILMTHVGRPKDKKSGIISISNNTSVQPIVDYLQNKLSIRLKVPEFSVDQNKGYLNIESSINQIIAELRNDEIQGIYLPNTRWFYGEESKGEEGERFARQLAQLADIYVNDAFGSWQPHASTALVPKYLPSYAGFLMQKEIQNLDRIYMPSRPFVAVVAGSKFDTKIDSLNALIKKADHLVLGGVIYNAYLCAKYGFKIKGISEEDIQHAHTFLDYSRQFPGKLVELPVIVESDTMEGKFAGKYRTQKVTNINPGTELNYVLDIAEESFEDSTVKEVFKSAKMFFVNAVMGLAPYFNEGTMALDQSIHHNKGAAKLFGGGDTLQELKRLLPGVYLSAVDDPAYYLFTGGGAVLKAIQEGKSSGLEPVQALSAK